MKYTDNYGLKKPDSNDYIEIDDLNENADIIDDKLKEHENELDSKETPAGAQAKADQAEQNAKQYTDEQVADIEVPVTSVNNKTGDVTVTKEDVGLGNVINELQASKTEFDAHKAEIATSTQLGHVMVDGETVTADSEGRISAQGVSESEVDAKISTHSNEYDVHGLRDSVVVLGNNASAERNGSIAIGPDSSSIYLWAIAIGGNAYASGDALSGSAVALGRNASAEGVNSVAIGRDASSTSGNEVVLGTSNRHVQVPGDFTVEGTKNFEIPHPKPDKKDTHRIRHSAVESPTAGDTLYRYEVEATEDGETVELQLPDYFQYLNKNVECWVNGVKHFGRAYADVEGDTLKVTCETAGKYRVLVIGTRNDDHPSVQNWDIKGVEREIGESWTGETYVFEVEEIMEVEEIKEVGA